MKKAIMALIIILVVGIAGYITYNQMSDRQTERLNEVLEQEQEIQQRKIEALEEEVATLQEELDEQDNKLIPKEKLVEVFGEDGLFADNRLPLEGASFGIR